MTLSYQSSNVLQMLQYTNCFRRLTLVNVKVTYFATIRTLSKQHVETLSSGRQSTQPLQAKH